MQLTCINWRVHVSNQELTIFKYKVPRFFSLGQEINHIGLGDVGLRIKSNYLLFIGGNYAFQDLATTGVAGGTI